jgi:hypothetical protein
MSEDTVFAFNLLSHYAQSLGSYFTFQVPCGIWEL